MTAPLRYLILDRYSYPAVKGYLTEDGSPTGAQCVIGEPTFGYDLNIGPRELQLNLTQNPLDAPLNEQLFEFDMIQVWHPDGRCMGVWKYELSSAGSSGQNSQYVLHLTPLAAELTETDFHANHSGTLDPDMQTPLGAATWDVPVSAGVPTTKHCSVGTLQSDHVDYDMVYPKFGKVVDTLNKAIDEGGPEWWWYVNGMGVVELRGGARTTHTLLFHDHVIEEVGKTWDATALYNVQPVQGGTTSGVEVFGGLSYNVSVPLASQMENDDDDSFYAVPKIGRRVAPVWHDPGVTSQAGCDQLARELLARRGVPIATYSLRLLPGAPLLTPGDKVTYTNRVGVTVSGLWVKSVEEVGSTLVQVVALTSQFDIRERPFRASGSSGAMASQATSGVIADPFASGTGGCGGYQPLARSIPGTASAHSTGSTVDAVRIYFILDSGDNCQIDCRANLSLLWVRDNVGDDPGCTVRLMCDTGSNDGAAAASAALHVTGDGTWVPVSLAMPSGRPLPAATYQLWVELTGPAGTWTLDYDLQAWVYSGGNVTS